MKSLAKLIEWVKHRSLSNFPNQSNMLANIPEEILSLIDTYNGCTDKYNFMLTCKSIHQAVRLELNKAYRNHFIPMSMMKKSFIPLFGPDHCLLPASTIDPVVGGTMTSGILSTSQACFACLHYLPLSALFIPTIYSCINEGKNAMVPMPLDHKCFHNRKETYSMVQDNVPYIIPEDSPIVLETYRFSNEQNYSKSVTTVCDEGCMQYIHTTVALTLSDPTVERVPTAMVGTRILQVTRHSKHMAIVKLQVTIFMTPEVEMHAEFLSSANYLDYFSFRKSTETNRLSDVPFIKTYASFVLIDPYDENVDNLARLYNAVINMQRTRTEERRSDYSPYRYLGHHSLPPSLYMDRDELLRIINKFENVEGPFPFFLLSIDEEGREVNHYYHFAAVIKASSFIYYINKFGGNNFGGNWIIELAICSHNLLEEEHRAAIFNLRDNMYVHYGLCNSIEFLYVKIAGTFLNYTFELPHLQCDELLSESDFYSDTSEESDETDLMEDFLSQDSFDIPPLSDESSLDFYN